MTTCHICGKPAKAVTQERVKAGKTRRPYIVTVYHHERSRCREFEADLGEATHGDG